MGLHQVTLESMRVGWEFEAEAQHECLGFGFSAGDIVPVVVGVVSSKHFVRYFVRYFVRWDGEVSSVDG